MARTLATYDDAVDMIQARSEDPCASIFLARRKHDLERTLRNADPGLHDFMEKYDKERTTKRDAMHKELRKEDAKRLAEAEKKKKEDALKNQQKEEAAIKRKREEEIRMGTDISWNPHSFGTAAKFTAEHKKNIQDALRRVKLRSPALPEELEANWKYFLQTFPDRARAEWALATGKWFHNELIGVQNALGKHYFQNPSLPSKKPRADSGGDPLAFETWMRQQMALKCGDGKLWC